MTVSKLTEGLGTGIKVSEDIHLNVQRATTTIRGISRMLACLLRGDLKKKSLCS